MSCQPAELQQVVPLQTSRQLEVVEVVKAIDGIPESLVILLFNQEIVESIVDNEFIALNHASPKQSQFSLSSAMNLPSKILIIRIWL